MAKVIPIGEPVNDAERLAIAHLRDHLTDAFTIVHNFEIVRDGSSFEVDLAVLAPHAVYLIDVKGVRGLVESYGASWYPDGRAPYRSPLLKLNGHARALKGLLTDSDPSRPELQRVYVEAVVLLTAPDAHFVDKTGQEGDTVVSLKRCAGFFNNAARVPARFSQNIGVLYSLVLQALRAKARPRSGPLHFDHWIVDEKLGGIEAYTDYRGHNRYAGLRSGSVLLRAYKADPYLLEPEREAQQRRIQNAYRALARLTAHPGVASVRDFFPTEEHDRYILVTEDVSGRALKIHLAKADCALTLDQKLAIAADIFSALAHVHASGVVHRNLTPSTVLVTDGGRARLIDFDFARATPTRSQTVAAQIAGELDIAYQAWECIQDPAAASAASDIFSAGIVIHELFTGERPFKDATDVFDCQGKFAVPPSTRSPELPAGFDAWLEPLCALDPKDRPTAKAVSEGLAALLLPKVEVTLPREKELPAALPPEKIDYRNLPSGMALTRKYVIEKKLGQGQFGVVYKAFDTLGDVSCALKIVLRDRISTIERLKKEYKALRPLPDHPNVVKVLHADILPDSGPPFIVFEYVDGLDVGEMIDSRVFVATDGLQLAADVARGLAHLHAEGVHHCDIKPRNLLWTDAGVRIIDFNVSVRRGEDDGPGGGTRRYMPPDFEVSDEPSDAEMADRDIYALGLSVYEAVTGQYPWGNGASPPAGKPARDPRELSGCADLAPDFVEVILRAIAPKRVDRYASAQAFGEAIARVKHARRPSVAAAVVTPSPSLEELAGSGPIPPNTNPFVRHLLTLYSQSPRTNAGTRGLDALGRQTYVETALDRDLTPAVLRGELQLVVITGNAGDGKTAFLQLLEDKAKTRGAAVTASTGNGSRLVLEQRTLITNYDGSQDEGERSNDDVLDAFFAPFAGAAALSMGGAETRLIAINEGRLVDFLESHATKYSALAAVVRRGLTTGKPEQGIAVVNLNLRSVVAEPKGLGDSLLKRLVERMTHEQFWEPCQKCDLRDRCYALHNARTFQDPAVGTKVTERLSTLYTLVHLRARLHITLRDLRSALAFMLVGTRDCDEIHALYASGARDEIAASFYFNSWLGGGAPSADRLLAELSEIDVGRATDPRLDRAIGFVSPETDGSLMRFEARRGYDRELLRALFDDLPRDDTGRSNENSTASYRRYVAMTRRRSYFERRDPGWSSMLPYRAGFRLLEAVNTRRTDGELPEILHAISRGEGLARPERLGKGLALRVRRVENGLIRSYRVFPASHFELSLRDEAREAPFVEHMPSGLLLRYRGDAGAHAELRIDLDVFEMLARLNAGYRPSVEEEQGYWLSVSIFKNILASAPYHEVLLTVTGHDLYRVVREDEGLLRMSRVEGEAN